MGKTEHSSPEAHRRASLRLGMNVIAVIAVVIMLGTGARSARADFFAERIDKENFETHHVGGPDAIGGIDDWFLSNGFVCAVISDPDHMTAIAPQGGVLIDLGHCEADDDQWTVLQPILNLSMAKIAPVTKVAAGSDTRHAWIRTWATAIDVEIATTYSLDSETPSALLVSIEARRIHEGDRLFSFGSVVLHPSGQTPAFSLLRSDLERSLGFVYPESTGQSAPALMKALASSDLTILVGGDEMPPISYGLERISTRLENNDRDEGDSLATFSVTGRHFTLLNSLPNFIPFAFTNPIFVDHDGNGRFDPPGLPDTLPSTITNADRPD